MRCHLLANLELAVFQCSCSSRPGSTRIRHLAFRSFKSFSCNSAHGDNRVLQSWRRLEMVSGLQCHASKPFLVPPGTSAPNSLGVTIQQAPNGRQAKGALRSFPQANVLSNSTVVAHPNSATSFCETRVLLAYGSQPCRPTDWSFQWFSTRARTMGERLNAHCPQRHTSGG